MTDKDKLEKLIAEIDRLLAMPDLGYEDGDVEHGYKRCLIDLKRLYNSMPKEPNFNVGDTIRNVDSDIRTVVEVREDCYKLDDCSILHFNAQDKWKLVEKNVSVDLEDAAEDYGIRQGAELKPFAIKFFKAGAKWQKQQMMHGAEEAVVKHRPNDYGEYDPYIRVRVSRDIKEGSKVKVLIIKED